jgi:hypothetical protein
MLPDLIAMARASSERIQFSSAELKAGWDFHLRTDEVFHRTRSFQVLNRTALDHFARLKIRKGPARACAHIGVEMLIDASLAEDSRYHAPYVQALRWGAQRVVRFGYSDPSVKTRLSALLEHLADEGPKVHNAEPERLAFRLERTLYDRPKLKPTNSELQAMAHYLGDFQFMSQAVEELLVELQDSPL